jgi:Putative beta barrel porin-7 (BBP7)
MRRLVASAICFLVAGEYCCTARGEESLIGVSLGRFYDDALACDASQEAASWPAGVSLTASYTAAQSTTDKESDGELAAAPMHPQSGSTSTGGGCQVDVCCGPPLCCRMCPCTYAWAEGLLWWRDNQTSGRPLVLNLNSGDTLIGSGDVDFDAAGGVRVGYGFRTCSNWAWEIEYFGLFDQSGSESIALANQLALPGNLGLAVNNFFFADNVAVRYESDIQNVEFNRVCCCCCCGGCPTNCSSSEWLYGFRYLNLHETFAIVSTDLQESTSTYRVHTDNNLFGAQIGRRLRHCDGRWSWEGTGKAGIFGNAAEQSSDPIIDFPGFVFRNARSASEGDVAFVGDLNLSAIYQLNSVWGIRTGYNLMWIEGVALAPDQFDFTNTPTSGTSLSTNGVFLQGINVGLEARW